MLKIEKKCVVHCSGTAKVINIRRKQKQHTHNISRLNKKRKNDFKNSLLATQYLAAQCSSLSPLNLGVRLQCIFIHLLFVVCGPCSPISHGKHRVLVSDNRNMGMCFIIAQDQHSLDKINLVLWIEPHPNWKLHAHFSLALSLLLRLLRIALMV